MPETLKGLIERVTFHNPENGFAVLKVKVRGQQDLVTVLGSTTSVTAGEHVEATGRWVVDQQHGQQFKSDELKTTHPASAEGIEKYLASGAIRSIGPKLAASIVAVHKERTLEILETAPDFLLHIKGIGQKKLKRICQSWEEQREVRKIMLFLSEHGIGSGRSVRIYRTYHHEAIAKIKENPYQLADAIRGIGFKTADEIAAKMGIDRNSPHLARAAVRYALQELASQGHCGYPEPEAVEHTTKLVEIDQGIVEEAVRFGVKAGLIVRDQVEDEPWLYLTALHRAEVGLAQFVRRIASSTPHPLPSIKMEKAISWVEEKLAIKLATGQQEAIQQACQHKFLVITGGPGVGKTTLVRTQMDYVLGVLFKCKELIPGRFGYVNLFRFGHPVPNGWEGQHGRLKVDVTPLQGFEIGFAYEVENEDEDKAYVFRKTALQYARAGEDLNRQVAADARLGERVMMTHYPPTSPTRPQL